MAPSNANNSDAPPPYVAHPDAAHTTARAVELSDLESANADTNANITRQSRRSRNNGTGWEVPLWCATALLGPAVFFCYMLKYNGLHRSERSKPFPTFLALYMFLWATGLFLLVLYIRIRTLAKKRRVGDWVYALMILLGLPLCAGYGMTFAIQLSTRKEPRWEW